MTATATDRRYYSPAAARAMVATIQAWVESSEDSLVRAEDRGDDDSAERISDRLDCLQSALDALEGLELWRSN